MNTVYLHVGPHKTGTTFLQKFLLDNATNILKSNVLYPKRFLRIFGHHLFRDALEKKSLTPEDIKYFERITQDIVLSSENFISLNREHLDYLREALHSKNFVVIYAWRRSSLKMYSAWQEVIKHGGTRTFFDYYHEDLARPEQSLMLSPDLRLDFFSGIFGKRSIKIIDYDASARKGTLVRDFLSIVNVKWSEEFITPEDRPAAINRSMDFTDIEVLRALNHIMPKRFGVPGNLVRIRYVEHLEKLNEIGLGQLKDLIRTYEQLLTVGDYHIDNWCEKSMLDGYKNNIINYEPATSLKQIALALPDWVLDLDAQARLNTLALCMEKVCAHQLSEQTNTKR